MNYNYRDWVAIKKIDKPMSNMRTINYLIKCYNIKKINDINKGRLNKADKYDLICQGLKNVKKDLETLQLFKDAVKEKDKLMSKIMLVDDKINNPKIIIELDVKPEREELYLKLKNTLKEWLDDKQRKND